MLTDVESRCRAYNGCCIAPHVTAAVLTTRGPGDLGELESRRVGESDSVGGGSKVVEIVGWVGGPENRRR
jgi:hypothetical protein